MSNVIARDWLSEAVTRSVGTSPWTLLTGEPGAGKTTILMQLADDHPDWLTYFLRRDSVTPFANTDLASFLLTIGHQLAQSRPTLFEPQRLEIAVKQRMAYGAASSSMVGIRIEDLIASPFHHTSLTVDQDVRHSKGYVTGIHLGKAQLEPRLLEPATLTELALFGPAAVLAAQDPTARIVILVDAVDELLRGHNGGLLDWLLAGPPLPPNVRIVMTARPSLNFIRPDVAEVTIDPTSRAVRNDLDLYARSELRAPEIVMAVEVEGIDLGDFRQTVLNRAAGNFLYLATYIRALAATGDANLIHFRGIPPGLPGLYEFFLARVRHDVGALGRVELTDRSWVSPWESAGQVVLGLLTVARAPLTPADLRRLANLPVEPRVITNILFRMRWLLTERAGMFSLYHSSIGEYFSIHPQVGPSSSWHDRIVSSLTAGRTWPEVSWKGAGDYELSHIAWHLVGAGRRQEMPLLISRDLRVALRSRFPTDRVFLEIVEFALEDAVEDTDLRGSLPLVLTLSIVRQQLRRGGAKLAPAVLSLCARLSRLDTALEQVRAIGPSEHQAEAMHEILTFVDPGDPRHRDLCELLVELALGTRGAASKVHMKAMGRAAENLARYDLARALRLAERAGAETDPVLASAALANPANAASILARMGPGLTWTAIELGLPLQATAGLERLEPRERLVACSRLAEIDPFDRARHLDRIHQEARGLNPESYIDAQAMAEAATTIAGIDEALARWLLRTAGRNTSKVAEAWALLGDTFEARASLESCLAPDHRGWVSVDAIRVLRQIDPNAGDSMLVEAVAQAEVAPPSRDLMSELVLSGQIRKLVETLGLDNTARARDLLRRLPNHGWQPPRDDRATVKAQLAHRLLDVGRTPEATALLNELLADATASSGSLQGDTVGAPFAPAADGISSGGADGQMMYVTYLFNIRNQWASRIARRLYTDPADVAEAISPGPSSVGSRYSFARTLRIYIERLATEQFFDAAALAPQIADPGERAAAYGSLFTAAIDAGGRGTEETHWQEMVSALHEIPDWTWLVDSNLEDQYEAYLRPDLRARFDTARAILRYETDPGMDLLTGLQSLSYLYQMSFAISASTSYVNQVLAGHSPQPELEYVHQSTVQSPPSEVTHPLVGSIVRAAVSVNEHRITGRDIDVDDPIYDLLARTAHGRQPPTNVDVDFQRLPALAGVISHNRSPALSPLAERVRTAAESTDPPDYEALLILARAGYGDPIELIERIMPSLDELFFVKRDDLLPDLAPLLLKYAPARALRYLAKAVEEKWSTAIAFLEYAAPEVSGVGPLLPGAVRRALECCAMPAEGFPSEADGVWLNP